MRLIRSSIFVFLLLVIAGIPAQAQDPVSVHYTADDGLPSNEVYDIFEDSLGYIWFATDHGISRFDGYAFKNYSTNDGLTHNTVFGFFEDHRHRIWMRTFGGSICYMEKGSIHPWAKNDSLVKFLGKNFIETFAIDSLGDLWFVCVRPPFGLFHQDHKTGKIKKIKLQPGYDSFIREIDDKRFIAGVDNDNNKSGNNQLTDTVIYNDHTWLFNSYAEKRPIKYVPRAARITAKHHVFAWNGKVIEISENKVLRRMTFDISNPVNNVFADDSSFWIQCQELRHEGAVSESFFRDILFARMLKDKRGSYWLACNTAGVIYVPNIHVHEIQTTGRDEIRLIDQYEDNLFAINKEPALIRFPLGIKGPDTISSHTFIKANSLHGIAIHESTKTLYAGSTYFKLNEQEKLNSSFKPVFMYFGVSDIGSYVRSSFRHDNRIFLASNGGWFIIDKSSKLLYSSLKENFSKFCFSICLDSTGRIWVGTTDGLYLFKNNKTVPFHPDDSLFRQRVTDIKCMPNGTVVVSSRGGGVSFIDGEDVYHLTAKEGLTTNLCGKLAVEDTVVWVCSNSGLNRILVKKAGERLRMRISAMRTEHGLPSNLINDALRYKDLLILATAKSLCWFDVRKVHPSNYTPIVYISEIQANQQSIDPDRALQYNQNNLEFSFIGLLYNNAGKVQYRYMLEGYEDAWHYTTDLSVRYFNLPVGNYRFVVAAVNEDGRWSSDPATWSFTIPPHFSETWWFGTIILVLIIAILSLVLRYYLRQRRARERITSDLLLAELKTLRSQMKPHFIFNSLSSIQHFILENDQESAHLYLSRFSALMRKILENTQRNTISLTREIETLDIYLSLETLRFGKNFEYTISIDSDIVKDMTEVPPMLIQPYVENAIWHGLLTKKDNPRLWVRFFEENGTTLVCEIEDNGIGRKASGAIRKQHTHQSTGMKNIQERIGILNRVSKSSIGVEIIDLYDTSGNACGTKVVLKLYNTLNAKNN